MTDCIFCKIVAGELPAFKVYEDENVIAFLDIFPANFGHTLVIPKEHFSGLRELHEEKAKFLFPVGQKVAKALYEEPFNAQGVNFLLSDGKVAGQEIFHIHLHVIPRYADDDISFRAPRKKPSREELRNLAEKLQAKIK